MTARPAGRQPTTSYTLSWDVFQGNLAGLLKYIVSYREVINTLSFFFVLAAPLVVREER